VGVLGLVGLTGALGVLRRRTRLAALASAGRRRAAPNPGGALVGLAFLRGTATRVPRPRRTSSTA
jgi:hypothetical protein